MIGDMSRMVRELLLSFVAVVVAIAFTMALLLWPNQEAGEAYVLMLRDGSMLISDAGTAIGGFEYVGSYNVSIVSDDSPYVKSGEKVKLRFALEIGLGDPISDAGKSELSVTAGYGPDDNVSFKGGDFAIVLHHFENDTVWDHEWDGYYIASWGGYAPEEELRGVISPEMFGLPEHYYVELRMDFEILPPSVP